MNIPEELLAVTDTITHGNSIRISNTPHVGVQLRVSPKGQLYYAEKEPYGQLNATVINIAKKHTLLPYVQWGGRYEALLTTGAHSESRLYPYYLLQLAVFTKEEELQELSQTITEHLKTIPVPTS